jgi:hypothetical protein
MNAEQSRHYISFAGELAEAGDDPVPRDYIVEALERVDSCLEEVDFYPDDAVAFGGCPSFKEVLEIARWLYRNRYRES